MNIKLLRCLTFAGSTVILMGCAGPKTTAPNVQSGTTIPELSECKLQLKDLQGHFGLVEVPGSPRGMKQMSLEGAAFDQDASYFQCGVRRARLKQSGHSFEVAEPITFQMTGSDPLTYAREWSGVVPKSESVLWIEPGDKPGSIVVTTDVAGIPAASLEVLGIPNQARPNLRLQFHVIVREGGSDLPFLFGEGTEYWGATKGPVDLGGKQFSRLKGAKVINGDLWQER